MNKFFISHKNPILAVLLIIMVGGVYAFSQLKTGLFPEITFPKIKIIADAELQPVDKMVVTVTRPLENAVKQVPDLQLVRSTTSRGSCELSAFMNPGADIDLSQQRIESQIAKISASLPTGVNISVEKMNPSILPVSGYSLESHNYSSAELKKIATYTVKPFLSQVDGVSEIRVIGGKSKEYWLELDVQKMQALGITPDQISNALSQTNFIKSNGYLTDHNYLYLSVTDATVKNKNDLENLVLSRKGNRIIKVMDVAKVNIQQSVEYTRINANGKDGILIAVIKQPNANLVDLSNEMFIKVEQLKRILPAGVSVKPYYVQADFVNESVKSVRDSLLIGLALAILVAIVFLRSFKASVTILITIPVTLCLTIIALYFIGYSLNIMTLGAIAAAIGLIIDDAIVVVEQIHRTHEEHPEELTMRLLSKAVSYLFPAMLGSSISTIVIFVPFVLMTGVAGSYFQVMTNTMIITLVCSFFVTWIGLPVIYLLLTRKGGSHAATSKKVVVHEVKPQNWVRYFIQRPYISIIFMLGLIASILLVFPRLETGFLPEMDEGSIVLDYASPPGTSLEETDRMLKQVEKEIVKIPDVQAYSRRTGTQMGFFITEPNTGDYLIQLKHNRTKSTEEVISEIRTHIENTQPALVIDFGQVIGDMLGDLMSSTQPVEVKIFGNDQEKLQVLSKKVADLVSHVGGTADVFDGIVRSGPTVNIQPNFTMLAQYGVSPVSFQSQVQTAMQGTLIGDLYDKQQLSPIRMVYPGSRTFSVADINKLKIFLPDGTAVPIQQMARVDLKAGIAEVARENLQTIGVVTARLDNRDLGSVMKDLQKTVNTNVNLPSGYHIEYGGAYKEQQQSFSELLTILIASSLLVFSVILFLFKDFKIAFLILLISVLGISGSYLALFLTHTPLNVGSYTGLIMIVGIIGENAIFTFLQFKKSLAKQSVDDAITFAISTRLRPKLMTALGAIIALMPLALGIGAGAQLHQPLAIAVIGGFIVAMPLLLIALPSLIRRIYK
ncbi:Cobalt-zinc-cadmium resistance protein CzcA [Pedobacter sp. Bi27]|uniref:efflux RND transporter permease subunit n=1 Tax=unclassified Pedobacter TaxID=2628915 RepID=UPI001E10B7CB|nr:MULTISPECIES: efflux RND transporter permease subunit [unclassified Pedobacter]CAH0123604.1 Cobalt-zinc-cadmium resistance protein CzcA [Pedobacter sp. Bi36]CAH0175233.1 Cobalt-zinc-cadmium resistance protein CzcA [Pedobacter sp. Bi126]CAH0285537.1 Cobalt-zinc-cadmium resistance protein CzcA [Pedobacter sp. Bi27]